MSIIYFETHLILSPVSGRDWREDQKSRFLAGAGIEILLIIIFLLLLNSFFCYFFCAVN